MGRWGKLRPRDKWDNLMLLIIAGCAVLGVIQAVRIVLYTVELVSR